MVGAVIVDMYHFGLIFGYSVGCAFIIQWKILQIIQDADSEELVFLDVFIASFTFSALGDNGSWAETDDRMSLLFYVCFAVINVIVLLNLLVSVISETYDRVQENQTASDAQEKCILMLEVEEFIVWRRHLTNFKFVHFSSAKSGEVVDSNAVWEGKIRAVKNQVNQL